MITLEYYRYLPTLQVQEIKGKKYKGKIINRWVNIFTKALHATITIDQDFTLNLVKGHTREFLNNHYGCVIIYLHGKYKHRLCNCKKMKKELEELGLYVILDNKEVIKL